MDALLGASSLEGVGCVVADAVSPVVLETLVQKMQERPLPPPLIFVTDQAEAVWTARLMKSGLHDVVDRLGSEAELLRRTTAALHHDNQQRVIQEKAEAARKLLALLSPREKQVLGLVVMAKSNKEISSDLHLSPRTVENHRARILRKLQADSAMHLLRITLEARGIPL
jgi:FixJ family two-component response regulator